MPNVTQWCSQTCWGSQFWSQELRDAVSASASSSVIFCLRGQREAPGAADWRSLVNQTDVRCCHAGSCPGCPAQSPTPLLGLPSEKATEGSCPPTLGLPVLALGPRQPCPPASGPTTQRHSETIVPRLASMPLYPARKLCPGAQPESGKLPAGRGGGGSVPLCNSPGQRRGERQLDDQAGALGETWSASSPSLGLSFSICTIREFV